MKERPILMSAPMVRAILDGRKTQTRRVVVHQPTGTSDSPRDRVLYGIPDGYEHDGETFYAWQPSGWSAKSPYGAPGDRLWARETWALDDSTKQISDSNVPIYRADWHGAEPQRWRPSIFMPRWASRITLEIVNVRVERVQEITKADVIAEGIEGLQDVHAGWHQPYAELWDSINAKRGFGWDANPWVWCISFKRAI